MTGNSTRERIIEVADRLIYERGYEHTSFADIAAGVKISRGNFYHHFKTKDEILDTVIERRLMTTRHLLDEWEMTGETPAARICCFVRILVTNRTKIMQFGCPVGTLAGELTRLGHRSSTRASALFSLFREWLCRQFEQLGRAEDADELAMELLAWSQGVATLASALRDEAFLEREVERMCEWVKTGKENVPCGKELD
ncbi:MAG: TetR/AcrR family transcriptional regulator [Hyphomicrobiaceae bacterium]|nr:TetR/AcrR family transcriptional regulator [Hyphomicrobiaceae bacterium]